MYDASIRLAKEVGYYTVGTVEFLVQGEEFYFMEMNTRLQVEHSVTEMALGIDIVKWQIRTAADVKIPFSQDDVKTDKYAIECRICAENEKDFSPSTGEVKLLHIPGGPDVRFDSALYQNLLITPFYDSMLGKLIVGASSREDAIRKMKSALSEFVLVGVENNRELYMKFMGNDLFVNGTYDTKICQEIL